MVLQVFRGHAGHAEALVFRHLFQTAAEKAEEGFSALARKDALHHLFVVEQVAEDVGNLFFEGGISRKGVRLFRPVGDEDVSEKIGAFRAQELVFRRKVFVKGASADVRFVDDVLYRNFRVVLSDDERVEGGENRLPRLCDPSVRKSLLISAQFCVFVR